MIANKNNFVCFGKRNCKFRICSFGGFIDKCPDRCLLQDVLQHLVPLQMGEATPKDVPTVSMDTMELYSEMLEMVQSEMKIEM